MKITQFSDLKKAQEMDAFDVANYILIQKNTAGINKLRDRLMSELTIEELIHVKNIVEKTPHGNNPSLIEELNSIDELLASVISVKNPSADTNNNNVGSAPVSTGGSPSRKTDFSKFAVNNVSNVIFLNENSLCYVMNSEPLWNIDVVSSDVNMLLKRFPISEQRSSFYKDEVYFARKDIEKTIEKKLESGTTHAYIAYQIELKPKAYEKSINKDGDLLLNIKREDVKLIISAEVFHPTREPVKVTIGKDPDYTFGVLEQLTSKFSNIFG